MDGTSIDVRRMRSLARIARAGTDARQAKAAIEAFRSLARPLDFLWRYGTGGASYPTNISIRTPTGDISPTLYSWHDTRERSTRFFWPETIVLMNDLRSSLTLDRISDFRPHTFYRGTQKIKFICLSRCHGTLSGSAAISRLLRIGIS